MSRRLALLAAGFGAVCLVACVGAGCGPGWMTHRGAIDYEALDPAARLLVAEAAGPRAEGAVAAMSGLLSDKSHLIRAEAGQALGTWAAVCDPVLALPALGHRDSLVRGMAQAAYMESSGYGLAPVALGNTVVEVPPPILAALAELGDPAGMVDVKQIILAQRDYLRGQLNAAAETSVLAADILALVGDEGARRILIHTVESAEGPTLAKAVRACVRDDMGLGPTLLPMAFKSPDVTIRRAVMIALVAAPDPRLKAVAMSGLKSPDEAVRRNAIRALGNMGGGAPVSALAAKLNEPTADRVDVLWALGAIGLPAEKTLRDFARKAPQPPQLEFNALLALAPNANRDDVGWISRRLQAPNKYIRAAAAVALGKIALPTAQASLMTAAKDSDPLVRAYAARSLGEIGTVYAARQLLTMLEDVDPLVVSMAASGLGETRYPEAVPALKTVAKAAMPADFVVHRLGSTFRAAPLAAVEALGRIGTPEAVAIVRDALDSKSWAMRATAAQALAIAGDQSPETLKALEKVLKDPVNLVRAQAVVSLKALGKTYTPGELQFGS
jgi:HEAT repeat protein